MYGFMGFGLHKPLYSDCEVVMKEQRRNRNRGFSLVELMIALAVGAVLVAGVFNFFASMEKSYTVQEQMSEMQQNARVGMDFMTKEIRLAGYGVNAGEIITAADDDSITFRGDALLIIFKKTFHPIVKKIRI